MNTRTATDLYRENYKRGFKTPSPRYPRQASSGYDNVGVVSDYTSGYNQRLTQVWKDQEKEWISIDAL